ncbi:hypothetical protein [Deinococcus sedimenti]|uniref:Lipoprotein n=1 Tax=Deinococcus sedimenti TaxID=1867090 RepID=A0ABQ2S2W0_9DEIO|nr:hypothetical protein [Deinococcus sedimenti]GGR83398.1 hypothetical protein GCM10008960_08050 [Deinococcus sedimenti]
MSRRLPLVLTLPILLAACGGTPSPSPNPAPTPTPGNAITTRLAACPVVNTSSDPAASSCLAGTYTGTTLSGSACSLTVAADGAYTFTSPTLTYSFTPTAQAIRVFGHQTLPDLHQVIWLIDDSVTATEPKELDFHATWGRGAPSVKLDIQGTKHLAGGGSTSVTCTVPL